MISFLQNFGTPEFDDAHSVPCAQAPGSRVIGPRIMDETGVPSDSIRDLIASLPTEGQLPPCLDSQRLIFNDEAIPEGAQIVHSGYCGSRIAVIVEMPAPKAGRWR